MASNSSNGDCCEMATPGFSSSWTSPDSTQLDPDYQVNDFVQRIIVAILLSLISILGLAGNTLVLFSILLSRKLQTQTNIFVVNLCVADFLTCLSLPLQAAATVIDDSTNMFLFSDGFCAVVTMLEITCLGCSILTLTLIAVNRFVLITRSKTTCRRIFSPMVLVISLLATWLIPAAEFGIPAITGFIDLSYYPRFRLCAWNENYPISKFLIGVTLVLALFVTLACYAKTYIFVRKHAQAVANLTPAVSRQNVNASDASLTQAPQIGNNIDPNTGIVPPKSFASRYKRNKTNDRPLIIENISSQGDGIHGTEQPTEAGCSVYEDKQSTCITNRNVGTNITSNEKSRMKVKSSSRNMEAQISKNLFVVVCVFVICIVPFVTCLSLSSCQEPFIFTLVILCMGSCVNPIIYGFRHPLFRPVFACIITCRLSDIPQPSTLARKIMRKF